MIASRLPASRAALGAAVLTIVSVGAIQAYRILKSRKPALPPPGPMKRDPEQLDKLLDTAIEDSMGASDPPSIAQPDVRIEPEGNLNRSLILWWRSLRAGRSDQKPHAL